MKHLKLQNLATSRKVDIKGLSILSPHKSKKNKESIGIEKKSLKELTNLLVKRKNEFIKFYAITKW